MELKPKKIVITGAAGRIGYQLLFLIAQGLLLGDDQPIILSLVEKKDNLLNCRSIQMELEDCLFPLLLSVQITHDPDTAFVDADYVFFCGAKICKDPKERLSIQEENWKALFIQGQSINRVCSQNTLFLMIANPCNTNTLALIRAAPHLPPTNFHSLVHLDQKRAHRFLAERSGCKIHEVEKVIIWGNHSTRVVPDWFHATIRSAPVASCLNEEWLRSDFIRLVQTRGEEITKARQGLSSCASPAYTAIEAMKALILPTKENFFFCSGIYSQNNPFGIDPDLVFALPCRTIKAGTYEILKDYPPHSLLRSLIMHSEAELVEERSRIKK